MSPLVHRVVRAHIRKVVKDPETARKLTPSYDMGCKRITPSDHYLQAFNKAEVSLVTEKIREITEDGVRTEDGVLHQADTILYATGFDLEKSLQPYKQVMSGVTTVIRTTVTKHNFNRLACQKESRTSLPTPTTE